MSSRDNKSNRVNDESSEPSLAISSPEITPQDRPNDQVSGEQRVGQMWVPTGMNQSDTAEHKMLSTSSVELKESDNRWTWTVVVDALEGSFGVIDFDPCWHPDSPVKPKAYLYVGRGDDGLRDSWSGRVVLVNPPWSKKDKWLKKAHQEWLKGNIGVLICLVPVNSDSAIFQDVLCEEADIFLFRSRPKFFRPGVGLEGTKHSTMLVVFGASEQQKESLARRLRGKWVPTPFSSKQCTNSPDTCKREPGVTYTSSCVSAASVVYSSMCYSLSA